MKLALKASELSPDNRTKVGACIVNLETGEIVSTGCNIMPNNCEDFTWELGEGLNNKHLYVVHAELNAILNARRDLTGLALFTTLFPCNECAKAIIQSGISHVFYSSDKYKDVLAFQASRLMLNKSGIKLEEVIVEC
jgi:dCMP deaminase